MKQFIIINNNKSNIINTKYINLDLVTEINVNGIKDGPHGIYLKTIDGETHCFSNDINSEGAQQLLAILKKDGISS